MSQDPGSPARLLGRRGECEALDRLVANARAGRSRVTVLRGEAQFTGPVAAIFRHLPGLRSADQEVYLLGRLSCHSLLRRRIEKLQK